MATRPCCSVSTLPVGDRPQGVAIQLRLAGRMPNGKARRPVRQDPPRAVRRVRATREILAVHEDASRPTSGLQLQAGRELDAVPVWRRRPHLPLRLRHLLRGLRRDPRPPVRPTVGGGCRLLREHLQRRLVRRHRGARAAPGDLPVPGGRDAAERGPGGEHGHLGDHRPGRPRGRAAGRDLGRVEEGVRRSSAGRCRSTRGPRCTPGSATGCRSCAGRSSWEGSSVAPSAAGLAPA